MIAGESDGWPIPYASEADTALPSELEKRLRINENVLRWLTVAENPCGIPPAPAAEGAPVVDDTEEKSKRGDD